MENKFWVLCNEEFEEYPTMDEALERIASLIADGGYRVGDRCSVLSSGCLQEDTAYLFIGNFANIQLRCIVDEVENKK